MRWTGKRMRRPRLLALAILSVIAAAGAAVMLAIQGHLALISYAVIGGMVLFYGLMFVSIIPRKTELSIEGDRVETPWISISVRRTEVGRWLMPLLDAPMGMLLEVRGEQGSLRIGGEDHDARGYPRGVARRSVDVALGRDDFDAAAAALGVHRGHHELVVELVRSSQSGGGVLRTMAPWLLTMAIAGGGSALAVTAGLPMMQVAAVTIAVVVLGLGVTVVMASRVRKVEIELRAGDVVRAEPRIHVVRMKGSSWTMPALELTLGDRTIGVVAWGGKADWEAPKARSATWVAGPAQFASLVTELRKRRVLDP